MSARSKDVRWQMSKLHDPRFNKARIDGTVSWNLDPFIWQKPRRVKFPRHRSLGTLYLKFLSVFSGPRIYGTELGPARGEVIVPAGKKLQLIVDEKGARDLSPLAKLAPWDMQMLSLQSSDVKEADLVHIEGLTWLEWLDLSCTEITGSGLVHLREMNLLERLDIWGTRLTDTGLGHLPPLPFLQELNLAILTEFTGDGLKHLQRLPALEVLDLHSTEIGDAELVHLYPLAGLRELYISYTRVSRTGVEKLRTALPNLKVSSSR